MADFYADHVADGTVTEGLGPLTLSQSPPVGYQTLVAAGAVSTNTVVFLTQLSSTWEISRGTFTAPATLTRDTFLSSNTGAPISWGAGTKTVSVVLDAATLSNALAQLATAIGWGDHGLAGYLTSETSHTDVVVDGDFVSNGLLSRTGAGIYTVVGDNSANWNTAFGWGDHGLAGYLTSQTSHADVVVDGDFITAGLMASNGAGVYSIVTNNAVDWNTAFGWGNHALAGYLLSETSHADVLVDGDFATNGLMSRTGAGTYSIVADNSANWNTAFGWGDHALAGYYPGSSMNPTGVDFSSVLSASIATGISRFYSATGGAPNATWSTCVTVKNSTTRGFQVAMGHTEDNAFHFRNQATDGTAWGTWRRVWSDADFNSGDKTNWDTAYGWGNHASPGYFVNGAAGLSSPDATIDGILLQDSADRTGLLEVNRLGATAWTGIQAKYSATALWSFMCSETIGGLYDDSSSQWMVQGTKAGQVSIWYNGSTKLATTNTGISVTGNVIATGDVSGNSDESIKTDWEDFPPNFVELLAGVKNGEFTRIDEDAKGLRQVGVSAQSLRPVIPNAVREGEDGLLSVVYGHAALASAVELAKELVELKKEMAEVQKQLTELRLR